MIDFVSTLDALDEAIHCCESTDHRRQKKAAPVLRDLRKWITQQMRGSLGIVRPNGRRGVVISRGDVQAIVYRHAKDGTNRCHGFGDADIHLRTRGDTLSITGLHQGSTGINLIGANDHKSLTIVGERGQRLWEMFPEEESE